MFQLVFPFCVQEKAFYVHWRLRQEEILLSIRIEERQMGRYSILPTLLMPLVSLFSVCNPILKESKSGTTRQVVAIQSDPVRMVPFSYHWSRVNPFFSLFPDNECSRPIWIRLPYVIRAYLPSSSSSISKVLLKMSSKWMSCMMRLRIVSRMASFSVSSSR